MITRVYKLEELSESAELLESGPPSWLQFLAFAVMIGLLLAGSWAGSSMKHLLGTPSHEHISTGAGK